MHYLYPYQSPLGQITLASDGQNLTGLWFDGQVYFASTLNGSCIMKDLPVFRQTILWLNMYFHGQLPDFTPPLRPKGSLFRQSVWTLLLSIPYGTTVSYGELARRLQEKTSKKTAAQAVGGAVAHNPISIIIPCHRVVGSSGSLTGYAGGIDKKYSLLTLEKADLSKLFIPASS